MLTVFHSWYQAHIALADGIFFALVGLAALSWVVTAARKALDWFSGSWADWTAAARFARRVRQARAGGAEAKAEKITQANTMTQPSRQMAA